MTLEGNNLSPTHYVQEVKNQAQTKITKAVRENGNSPAKANTSPRHKPEEPQECSVQYFSLWKEVNRQASLLNLVKLAKTRAAHNQTELQKIHNDYETQRRINIIVTKAHKRKK